jgi:uncharacterized RDD family membrane protein YckC
MEDEGEVIEPTPASEAAPPASQAAPPPPTRWAAPPAVVEVPGAPGLVFADVPSRLIGYLVDVAIVGVIGATLAIALGFGQTTVTSGSRYVFVSGATASVSFALLGFGYFVFFWTGGRRATIGQRVFDIQVGNAFDGRPLTIVQAIKRWIGYGSFLGLLAIAPGLRGFDALLQIFWIATLLLSTVRSQAKQGVHDRFANSALVRPSSRASGGTAMACLVVVVLIVVLFIVAIAALIWLGNQVNPFLRPSGTTI